MTLFSETVELPLWLVLLTGILALLAFIDRLFVPSVRWMLRRRVNEAIEELNTRLKLRISPFKLTKRQVLIERLTFDRKVLAAVDALAQEREVPRDVVLAEAEAYAREIVPAFNAYFYYRIGYWLARGVARLLYRVRLGFADDEGLAAVAPESTVVFVMNHRSNMDYVLVGYLAADRSTLSYAVGEWARIWPLQTLIRAMGAYFVRRNSRNPLYRRVLERYVFMATKNGVTQAIYPEGGLSRDGRLGAPKLGLFDYMVKRFDPRGEHDIVFVPVGINYDRVLEDRSLLLRLDPAATRRGVWHALRVTLGFVARHLWLMVIGRWHRFGYACVNFGSPISLRGWLAGNGEDLRGLPREARFARVEALATHLMGAVGAVVPVLPVPLVASVLLEAGEKGLSELELKAAVLRLMRALERTGAKVYLPRQDEDYAVTAGLRMLVERRLVRTGDGRLRVVPGEEAAVRYYANSIAHLLPQSVPA
ncbi:MAG: 1-acyl-sn-glycerol-3-phosphate acyltransferase [Alphaproteobacteria bacterium]|nr:1-acyl-sn-glycerol-3-phosphate acyltransferase [Alphaproteobacteria bacterium]